MSNRTKDRLAYYLKQLNKEELKKFQSLLLTHVAPSTCVMDVASTLVSWFGESRAWILAFQTWKDMGMKQLCSQAQQEKDRVLTHHPKLHSSPSTSNMESSSQLASIEITSDHEDSCDQMPKKKTFKKKPTKSECKKRAHHPKLHSSPSTSNMESSSQLASIEIISDHEDSCDQMPKKKTFKKKPTKSGCRTRGEH
ncbi:NACHT, LRR and PYD domains-containing protein 1-like [Peromyscus leucopus]|uniref:NACHT, LRR and PYD domains-containing protein 1-like n=1 Tax=Peromyscus leucopus TaxID=10041 RepID=UPI0018857027|nr:NACHT, LRR and PYD domains-containing protein 1-like [Peromyscus leucopus]